MAPNVLPPLPDAGVNGARPALLLGRQLGPFRVDTLIGRGGMGVVYRAWDRALARPVALKTVLLDDAGTRARFLREARAQAMLHHPHVVPIHFVGAHEGLSYLVMELVDGTSLAELLARAGRIPVARALEIADAIAAALEAAHAQGLIHRDVKPSNVLVDARGRVLLADFGLAKSVVDRSEAGDGDDASDENDADVRTLATHVGTLVGTPAYLAPEARAGGRADHRTDMYALGITLYEILTGALPFAAENDSRLARFHAQAPPLSPRLRVPDLPPAVEALVLRLLAKAPEERFASYADLRAAIADARPERAVAASVGARAIASTADYLAAAASGTLVAMILGGSTGPVHGQTVSLVVRTAILVLVALVEGRTGRSLGKRLVGIRTVNARGGSIGFGNGMLRWAIKLWGPIAQLGVALATTRMPGAGVALVQLGGTLALTWGGWLQLTIAALWLGSFALALGSNRLVLHDRAAGSRVIRAK